MTDSADKEPTAHAEIIEALRKHATGREVWRVQDPVTHSYCMEFSRDNSLNPEREAREWLARHCERHPGGLHTDFVVASRRVYTHLELIAIEAAAALAALSAVQAVPPGWVLVPVEPTQEMLRAATEYSASVPIANGLGYYRAMLAAAPLQGADTP